MKKINLIKIIGCSANAHGIQKAILKIEYRIRNQHCESGNVEFGIAAIFYSVVQHINNCEDDKYEKENGDVIKVQTIPFV